MKAGQKIIYILATSLIIPFSAWLIAIAAGHINATPPDQLAEIERRIAALEKVEPFEVVDGRGLPIFRVESRIEMGPFHTNEATVYNSQGQPVAIMGADDSGGFLRAVTADGERSANMGNEKTWGLHFDEMINKPVTDQSLASQVKQNVARLELSRRDSGNYTLTFFGKSNNQLIAGIGESKDGNGLLVAGDTKVSDRTKMMVGKDNKGVIGISNRDGILVSVFGEAYGNTGGELALGAANGDPRVKMGTNDNRYGIVIALPQGLAYYPRSGLPGSYLLGCAGGDSCVR